MAYKVVTFHGESASIAVVVCYAQGDEENGPVISYSSRDHGARFKEIAERFAKECNEIHQHELRVLDRERRANRSRCRDGEDGI